MGFREELIYRLVKWERQITERKEKFKDVWRDLRKRDKIIVASLVGVGIGQVVVGLAMIAAGV